MNAPVTIHAMLREVEVRLDTWAEAEERRCNVRRPPDFTMIPSYIEAHERKMKVTSFVIGLLTPPVLALFVIIIFLPL